MVQKKELKKCIVERIKIKKSDLKVLSAKKSALALYLWEKKVTDAFFTNTALLALYFATQK